jgi:hypothetical protein
MRPADRGASLSKAAGERSTSPYLQPAQRSTIVTSTDFPWSRKRFQRPLKESEGEFHTGDTDTPVAVPTAIPVELRSVKGSNQVALCVVSPTRAELQTVHKQPEGPNLVVTYSRCVIGRCGDDIR